jgi:hypothetical protein
MDWDKTFPELVSCSYNMAELCASNKGCYLPALGVNPDDFILITKYDNCIYPIYSKFISPYSYEISSQLPALSSACSKSKSIMISIPSPQSK